MDVRSIGNPSCFGYRGLLRNSWGGWIFGFFGSCIFTSNINVAFQAISHGLDLVWNLWSSCKDGSM